MSGNTLTLRDGEVILHLRKDSKRWQARYKLPNGTWVRISTKRANLADAKAYATDAYDKARFLVQHGHNPTSRRFRDVAKMTIADMETAISAGKSKTTYRDYIQALNKYLIPFLGAYNVDSITTKTLTEFDAWRLTQMKKAPARSTLLNHSGALNKVFETALVKGWIYS